MSSITWNWRTFHGTSVCGRGVFTNDKGWSRRVTYAGQHKDGCACGLGVATWSGGSTEYVEYAEHGPDGNFDGRCFSREANGEYIGYRLFKRGKAKPSAWVYADGRCTYNRVACAPDDPRVLTLIQQIAPVEVRPLAPAPTYHRPPLAPKQSSDVPACFAPAGARDRRGHRGPHRTLALVAMLHNWPQPTSSRNAMCDHAVTRSRAGLT